MKVLFHKSIPDFVRRPLKTTFDVVTKHYGIEDYDRTVLVQFDYTPDCRGAIGPDPSSKARVDAGKLPIKFQLLIRPDSLEGMIETFCHELVHLKQWVRGELAVVRRNGRFEQAYFNIPGLNQFIPYEKQPWEIEAHCAMGKLAKLAMKEIRKKESWKERSTR